MTNRKQPSEQNLKLRNAAMMYYYDKLKQRATEINEEIQNDLSTHVSESTTTTSKAQTAARLVEVYSLTLTYFEGVAFQFLRWGWQIDHELVDHVKEEARGEFPEGPPHEWDNNEKDLRMSHKQWMDILNKLDPSTNHFDALHKVKDRRGDYIHKPDSALEFRPTSDKYSGKELEEKPVETPEFVQKQREQPTLSEILIDCENALEEIEELVNEHLPIDDDIYSELVEDEQS
ncbi:hypothetical protein [Haloplanus salinus]|uniref:hypothetical protein n=1 Tax=Haloplanus salinus TaxID=1126245 RepID=UPI0011C06322|nr:hypothetical protein [Haloplanus salinus]